jgi:hypothetical protein
VWFSLVCREQLAESILHEGSTGCRVVEKFLKILQVVVQEPGQVFKPFLPSIIALCMEQVYPIIAEVGGAKALVSQPPLSKIVFGGFYYTVFICVHVIYFEPLPFLILSHLLSLLLIPTPVHFLHSLHVL